MRRSVLRHRRYLHDMSERRGGEIAKNIVTYVGLFVAIGGLIWAVIAGNNRIQNAKSQAIESQQSSDTKISVQISLNREDISDNQASIKKLDSSDDKNSVQINRIKDSLAIYATKEEVNAKFGNSSTTLKTDMMTTNSQLNNLNQRISHLEGAWQLWIINFYRAPPVLSAPTENVPTDNKIYDNEMYK